MRLAPLPKPHHCAGEGWSLAPDWSLLTQPTLTASSALRKDPGDEPWGQPWAPSPGASSLGSGSSTELSTRCSSPHSCERVLVWRQEVLG